MLTPIDIDSSDIRPWPIFPFPKLQVLDISYNPALNYLPIQLIALPSFRRIRIRHTALDPPTNLPIIKSLAWWRTPWRPGIPGFTRGFGVDTLVNILIRLTPKHDLEGVEDLPPHLVERLRGSYRCELCGTPQIQSEQESSTWMVEETSLRWTLWPNGPISAMSVHGRGRICRVCLLALTRQW